MATKTLARLCHGAPLNDGYMEITPPVVHSIIPLCKIGDDAIGNKLISLLEECGSCRNIQTKHIKAARKRDPSARTALAVLPIYQDGRRVRIQQPEACIYLWAPLTPFRLNLLS